MGRDIIVRFQQAPTLHARHGRCDQRHRRGLRSALRSEVEGQDRAMTPIEIYDLYRALVAETTIYYDAKARYERMRAHLIEKYGYRTFRNGQRKALKQIGKVA
jgi:hypothetical protein